MSPPKKITIRKTPSSDATAAKAPAPKIRIKPTAQKAGGGQSPAAKRRTQPTRRRPQRTSLMPLWILLGFLLVGGVTIVTTIKSNNHKAATKAYALLGQRKKATALFASISTTAASVNRIGAKAAPLRTRTEAVIASVIAALGDTEEAAPDADAVINATYADRPGLKSGIVRLLSVKKDFDEALRTVENGSLSATHLNQEAAQDKLQIMREGDVRRAMTKAANLSALCPRMEDLLAQVTEEHRVAEAATAIIERLAEEIKTNDQEAKEKKAREERKAELKKLNDADLARAQKQNITMLSNIKTLDVELALRELEQTKGAYKTDKGRESCQLMIDQCSAVTAMKAEIISQLSKQPFAWGWRQDGPPRDIEGATTDHIIVGDRNIPWKDISEPQLLAMLNKYILGSSVKPTTRSNHAIGTAIFLLTRYRYDLATTTLDTAISMRPSIREEVDRLTKGLFTPEE